MLLDLGHLPDAGAGEVVALQALPQGGADLPLPRLHRADDIEGDEHHHRQARKAGQQTLLRARGDIPFTAHRYLLGAS